MKLKNLLIFLIILTVLINISCIYATEHNTEILGENNEINIYVDANTGEDSNTGDSWETPVKSIGKAIDLTDNNKTTNIYLGNGTYKGENNIELKIENKNTLNIIGSNSTIINGENLKQILTLSNIRNITLKNIQFVNATSKNINYGVAITIKNNTNVLIDSCQFIDNTKSSIYNEGTLTITNTYFLNNKDRSNDSINNILGGAIYNTGNLAVANSIFKENYAGSGGAIYNTGNLTVNSSTFRYNKATNHGGSMIVDSIKTRKDGGRGGDICNFGNATITNTTFKETQLVDLGARGGSIYNNGTMLLKQVEISNIAMISDDPIGRHSAGTAIANIGNLTLKNSLIANITTHLTYQGRIQGAIQNEGLFTATGTLFVNNKPDRVYGHQIYYDIGTGNIYNTGGGILNITSCAFFNENQNILETVAQDVAIIAGAAVCLENNSWSGENPLTNNHIYGTLNVTKYWLLSLEPDYSMLEIGGKANFTQTMKLMYEKHAVDYGQLPDLYVTFNVNGENITKKLVDGKASVEFNQSDVKGSYVVTSTMFNIVKTADVDVGKEYSAMQVEAEEIYYGDDAKFYMTVTGNYTHQPKGNITVIIDENKYTTRITDTKASITIPGLIPKTYDLIIRYEGDEDYFKSIFHHNYTVHKKPTYMNITIPEINYGETGIITVSLTPNTVSTQAYMYITDKNNKTTKKTVFVKNGTEIKLKNYAGGEYNVTIELWDNPKFASSSASAIFKVNKFATNLTINSTDINAGETEILNITLTPKGEVAGEAILQINNHTQTIFLKNGLNTIKLENLTGGNYNISVTFLGDKKYASSTATCTFTVKMLETNITAKLENNILYINTTPNSTGKVFIYINDDIYEVNLTNSAATFPVNFKKAENYIFIYYPGDGYYDYATCNLTYECEELLNLTGYDKTFYSTENATYYVTLTDEEGYGIANRTIIITINKKASEYVTENDGSITLKLNPIVGEYDITAQYRNKTTKNKIIILEDAFLSVNNTKAYENVDFTHIAKLTDHNGKAIKNAEITFKINGKTYTNKTNKDGLAILTLNLKEGNYTITSTYKSVTKTSEIIIIDDSHLVGNDVKAYSGTDFTYKVKLTDHLGKGIANAEITFKINGKTYTNRTDITGQTTLIFNLETGNYTITANYKNRTITNNFEIIEDYILAGNDVKAYAESDFIYKIKLTDHNGKAIKNAEITFKINGKTYTNKTDVNGQAIINLNLKTGTYTITAKYRNTTTTNTLIIIEDYILSGNDIKAYEDDDFTYKVNLTDHNGKAIKNAEITFEIDGKTYTNKTNNQGLATITLNLEEGNYTITAKYRNITTNNELEIIENHVLTGQNVKAYENNDFTYTVTLKRTDGTPIPDKEITFIINNRRYTDTTNKEGKASKTLNLPQGSYTITSIYKNTKITNNLTIIEDYTLEANNIRAYANDNFQYKVNLTDHNKNPIKNAEITFEINGQTYKNKTDNKGQATITLNLKEGNYTITASYRNNKITNKLEIIETYTLKGSNVKSYENFDFEYTVTLKNHNDKTIENTEITFEINGQTYKNKTDNKGQATITLNLKEGNYTITAKYKNTTTTNKLNIIKYDLVKIESSDLVMYYKDGSRFMIRLTEKGSALTNKTVQFIINGNGYKRTTNNEGYASIAINLDSGIHNITTRYNNISTTNRITVKSTIEGNDLTKIYRNDTQYYATFYNSKGEPLKNRKVTFNINGVMYERNTNENGQAKMNINLIAGTYIITANNPENGEQHANTITVLSKIQENKDLIKYYKNASQYIVKIIDSKGNPVKAGQKVTFNINGVFYERYTNETGHVKMNINLLPGEYIITAEYEGCTLSNKIKVLPVLKASDLTKKYGTKTPFEATLLDGEGKPLKNTNVIFNINGVFYTRTTNENGIAKLNINLMPGEYIITSSYNGLDIANKVKIEA